MDRHEIHCGKVAVVTGASGGIGSAVARRLSEAGAHVVLVDLHGDAAAHIASSLPEPAVSIAADVGTEEGVESYIALALDEFGSLDMVHLNAGYSGQFATFADTTVADFDRVMSVNLRGVYLGMRAAVQVMRRQGSGGSIVATSSGQGLGGSQLQAPYSASKHGVLGLVRSAALDHARDNIRINAVCPGFTETGMLTSAEAFIGGDARSRLESSVPLGRYGRPSEIAAAVAWLLGPDSSYVTGEHLVVDGGVEAGAAGFTDPQDFGLSCRTTRQFTDSGGESTTLVI